MTQTAYNWLFIALLLFISAFIVINSCNQNIPETDNTEIKEFIQQHLKTSDSLHKSAMDSVLAIISRDSAHSVTINNIFNHGKQTKQEIINKPFNSAYVNGIRNLLDSVYSANK